MDYSISYHKKLRVYLRVSSLDSCVFLRVPGFNLRSTFGGNGEGSLDVVELSESFRPGFNSLFTAGGVGMVCPTATFPGAGLGRLE